ncbi:MAG: tRNA lysidine(34) synthetase TilS [Acholeplasmataceae bacterium]
MNTIIDLINQSLNNLKKHKLILSVSGGVDSMVMLHLLYSQNYDIEVVHFNHQKREHSVDEAKMVQAFCEDKHIPYHYFLIQANEPGNFHHQAHLLRKHYLLDVAKTTQSKYIITAHHLDDLLESILIKMTRGSNLLGYAGMQPIYEKNHIYYVKPLLYVSKQDLIAYAAEHQVPYLDDESNEQDAYLRNRYRHAIVPIMKQENPQLLEQIKQYHLQLSDAFKFIRKISISTIEHQEINIDEFKKLDPVIQNDSIAYLLENYPIESTYEKVLSIKQMLLSKSPNQSIRLSHQYAFVKAYKKASIETFSSVEPVFYEIKKGDNKPKNMDFFTFLFETSNDTKDLQKLCYNELAFPLWLRHRLDGDLLTYDYGHKKLKKLLIDQKVPMKKRDQLWILTDDNNQILWVENYYLNKFIGENHTLYFKIEKGA